MSKYKFINASLSLLLLVTLFSSCQKDEVTSKPVLMSFGPSTVKHGETITFIGKGLDQISEVVMPANISIPASSFTAHTSTRIELTVPQESTIGYVKLMTTKGDSIISKTMFGAAYTIAVRSFTPSATRPGTNITINGDFLNYVKQVNFSDKQTVTQFVSQSLHQLVVQIPRAAQTGPISLTDLASTPQIVDQDTLTNDLILNVTLPVATSLTPATGVEQTTNLTITGTDLDLVTEIDFAGLTASGVSVVAPFVTQSATQIVVTVPKSSVTGPLSLLVPSGVKVATSSVTILEPAITAMTTGRAGTDNVTITGTNLNLVASIIFPGNANVNSFISQASDGTSMVVAIPSSATPGALQLLTIHDFKVNGSGFNITLPVAQTYSTSTPGADLTITGTDLDLVTKIIFPDGTPVTSFAAQSSGSVTVTIPATATAGYLQFVIANGYSITQKPKFGNVGGADPVVEASLVYFDFNGNGKDSWWGGGSVVTDAPTSDDGTPYWTINGSYSGWTDFFWRNSANNFPGSTIGTSISSYVLKFDIHVIAAVTDGNLKLRLQDSDNGEGDFWYCVGPAAPATQGLGAVSAAPGWTTITIPLSGFADNYGFGSNKITDMSLIDTFGMAFDNGSSTVNVAIDNVRFEKIN